MGKEEILSNKLLLNLLLTKETEFPGLGLSTYMRFSALVGTKYLDNF